MKQMLINEQDKELILQMKKDLETARKIAGENKGESIDSLILAGIFIGRETENQRIKEQLELLGIKIPDNMQGILFKLKS